MRIYMGKLPLPSRACGFEVPLQGQALTGGGRVAQAQAGPCGTEPTDARTGLVPLPRWRAGQGGPRSALIERFRLGWVFSRAVALAWRRSPGRCFWAACLQQVRFFVFFRAKYVHTCIALRSRATNCLCDFRFDIDTDDPLCFCAAIIRRFLLPADTHLCAGHDGTANTSGLVSLASSPGATVRCVGLLLVQHAPFPAAFPSAMCLST